MKIRVTAKDEKELNMRIRDNEKRGWKVIGDTHKQLQDYKYLRPTEYRLCKFDYGNHSTYTKMFVYMESSDVREMSSM